MPEIASIPILSSTSPSVSTTAAAGAAAASSGIAGAGTAATAGHANGDSGLPQEQGKDSFANILKRQIDQPATATAPSAAAPAGNESAGLPPGLSLLADLANLATNLPQNAAPTLAAQAIAEIAGGQAATAETPQLVAQDGRAALLAAAGFSADTKGKAVADKKALVEKALATQATDGKPEMPTAARADDDLTSATERLSATQLANALFSLKPAQEGAQTEQSGGEKSSLSQPTEPTDGSLAALLAFFPPPNPSTPANVAKTAPATAEETGGKGSTTQMSPLLQSTAQDRQGDEASALRTETTGAAATPSGKTAEFAAAQAVTADPASPTKGQDVPNRETSFENAIAAANAQFLHHANDRDIRTPANTNHPLKVDTPVGNNGWDHEVGDKLVWMVGRQEQRAELVLNPPQLGRVEVSLNMTGDQTNATFVAANPAVREALESALPRLREMFADAGLSLGQAQVGADSGSNAANQSFDNRGNGDNSSRFSGALDGASDGNMMRLTGTSQWVRQGRGLVDVFA